jgi:hypothetical protein
MPESAVAASLSEEYTDAVDVSFSGGSISTIFSHPVVTTTRLNRQQLINIFIGLVIISMIKSLIANRP